MAGKFPRAAIVCLALAALVLPACNSGFKIGSWQIIKPKPPLVATRLEMERWGMAAVPAGAAHGAATQPERADLQRLALDLENGRGSFTDSNGKVYPLQLEPEVMQKIRDLISSRAWQTAPIEPQDNAANPVFYSLTVYNGNERIHHPGFWSAPLRNAGYLFNSDALAKDQGRWALPPEKPLPEGFVLLDDTFERAVRIAHPLSEKINLLK